jgi:FAD/FMN-containing dehydrogenase
MDLQGVEKAKNELRSELGEEKILDDDFALASYTREMHTLYSIYTRPSVLALPHTTHEVQKIIKVANKYKIPVVPSGGRTGYWCALETKGGIMMDLCNMNRILEIDEKNLTFTVQAGANVDTVNRELRKRELFYNVHPEHDAPKPFGSEVAKCTAGTIRATLGHVSKRLIGLQVVLGNGDILETGSSRVIKTTPNFLQTGIPDLTQLFVASEGAYGVITEVTMEMSQYPVARDYIGVKFEGNMDGLKRFTDAFQELRIKKWDATIYQFDIYTVWMFLRGFGRGAFGPTLRDMVRKMVPSEKIDEQFLLKQFGHSGGITVESLISQEECDLKKKEAEQIIRKHGGEMAPMVAMVHKLIDEHETEDWNWAKGMTSMEGIQHCVWADTPYQRVPEMYYKYMQFLDEFNWPKKHTWWAVSWGSNSCHPMCTICPDPHDEKMMQNWKRLCERLMKFYMEVGVIPYRTGRIWRPYILDKLDPSYLKYIMGIKKLFDPNNIMNPGVAVFEEEY